MIGGSGCRWRGYSDIAVVVTQPRRLGMGGVLRGFGFGPVAAIARIDAGDAVAELRPTEEGL